MFKGIYYNTQRHVKDVKSVLERAQRHSVEKLIITGTDLEDYQEAQELINSFPESMLYSTVGIHPTKSSRITEDYWNRLEACFRHRQVVAVGECGLDYERLSFSSKEDQKEVFVRHFSLAERFNLPMFLHMREAFEDFYTIVSENRARFGTGVVHSFTGTIEQAKQLIGLNLFIGINGCSLKTESNREVVKELPIDRILIETDAPWCEIKKSNPLFPHLTNLGNEVKKEKHALDKMVKGRNEPCKLIHVLESIAFIKQIDIEDLGEQIYSNTLTVFNGLHSEP